MKLLGHDTLVLYHQLVALVENVKSWFISTYLPMLQKAKPQALASGVEKCIIIAGPGGYDQLQVVPLKDRLTVGYNVPLYQSPFLEIPSSYNEINSENVVIKVDYFSVNYADVCIRWGLYESALRFVGWPIVPGFDFSGTIEWADSSTNFKKGDTVFGFSLFGAYSSHLLVPARQIRKTPACLKQRIAAGVPAAAATALHAVALAGAWPKALLTKNKAALIHSAAGGVGSMLIEICKLRGFSPIVAVVGSTHKMNHCKNLGADFVIDKSTCDLWSSAAKLSPGGYAAIFDANGVETIGQSYEHISQCGTLVVYGFHSNIPKAKSFINPLEWVKMLYKMTQMPKFDAMSMVLESKAVAGFNLSFFSDETALIAQYMDQIVDWIADGKIRVPDVQVFGMEQIGDAHCLIQSGQSLGKIVIKVD